MRLIDADELIKCRVENDPVVIAAKCAPTAYDVDKVVNGLNEIVLPVIKETIDKITKVWNVFGEKLLEVVDSIKLMCEQIREAYHHPVSRRYRIVKVLSKCTGTDVQIWWKITWKIRRWLARSLC